jgi:hypothetical protein
MYFNPYNCYAMNSENVRRQAYCGSGETKTSVVQVEKDREKALESKVRDAINLRVVLSSGKARTLTVDASCEYILDSKQSPDPQGENYPLLTNNVVIIRSESSIY